MFGEKLSSVFFNEKVTAPVSKNTKTATTAATIATEVKPAQTNSFKGNRGQGRDRRDGDNNTEDRVKDNNRRPKYVKEGLPTKGVPAEPHPLDRHSGTGFSGVE